MKHVLSYFILAVFSSLFAACNNKNNADGNTAVIETTAGNIVVELYPEKAPQTVAAFKKNVLNGVYNPAAFYRVLKHDDLNTAVNPGLIQGGIHLSDKSGFPAIPHESTAETGLSHTTGTVSMARLEAGSASTEFFICIGDQTPLDAGRRGTADSLGMAAFGTVIKGMDVVKKIQAKPSYGDRFVQPIEIQRIRLK